MIVGNSGYVYIVKTADVYKIGVSVLPEQRVSLIKTDNHTEVITIGFWQLKDPYLVEELLHEKYAKDKIRGEWFRLDEDKLLDVVMILDRCVEEDV